MSSGVVRPAFSVRLGHRLVPGLVCVARYDGVHACLTAVTASRDKVLLHNPQGRSQHASGGRLGTSGGDTSLLHMGEPVTALCSGRLSQTGGDLLCVGAASSVLVYDVLNNSDLFYRPLADGARAMLIGQVGGTGRPMLLVGSSCALQGFTSDGNDPYWNVTGDTIRSLAVAHVSDSQRSGADSGGSGQLLVGSDDHEIRVFDENDAIVHELGETAAVVALQPLPPPCFGYALDNGTVGVYAGSTRRWRIKSKHRPLTLAAFDIDGDGRLELVTGWSSGKVDARDCQSGNVVFRDLLSAPVAGLVVSDYRGDGSSLLVCCSEDGELRGYAASPQATSAATNNGDPRTSSDALERNTVHELGQRRNALQQQLRSLLNQQQASRYTDVTNAISTRLNSSLHAVLVTERQGNNSSYSGHVELRLHVTDNAVIRAAIVFAEGIFDDGRESLVQHPPLNQCSNELIIQLKPPRAQLYDLHVRALVAPSPHAQHFHVMELSRQLPRFSMLAAVHNKNLKPPAGRVQLQLVERIQRLAQWLNENLLVEGDTSQAISSEDQKLYLRFIWLHTGQHLHLQMDGSSGDLQLHTDCTALASQLVQALSSTFTLKPSTQSDNTPLCHFPDTFKKLSAAVEEAPQQRADERRLAADIATCSDSLCRLLLDAENARLLRHMPAVRLTYQRLHVHNNHLSAQHAARCHRHQQLAEAGKFVAQNVQQLARIHGVQRPATDVVHACRTALADGNASRLLHVLGTGRE